MKIGLNALRLNVERLEEVDCFRYFGVASGSGWRMWTALKSGEQ